MTNDTSVLGLVVDGVTVRFGGVVALDDVSLQAPLGACTGLIGPNGAGKTTLFNACFGLVPLATGDVRLDGRSLRRLSPASRARRGMSRTFQRMDLFESLSVVENVRLGREAAWVGANVLRTLYRSREGSRLVAEAAEAAVELCGLTALRDRVVGDLSTGQRRLVELARALANPAHILLLDEPSSGLDRSETVRFGEVLREALRIREAGILLVEHDMSLVSAVCDHVHVLDFGVKIFEGTMAAAQTHERVRAAYLGEPDEDLNELAEAVADA